MAVPLAAAGVAVAVLLVVGAGAPELAALVGRGAGDARGDTIR